MERRTLGADVCMGAVGLGCAGMSGAYGHSADEQSVATLPGVERAVHPITDVQVEYSLFSRGVEAEIPPTCRELGIGITAYGVLAQGKLTGTWQPSADDARHRGHLPRFAAGNIEADLAPVERLRKIATARGVTVAQLAIAWVLAQGRVHRDIVALVGAGRPHRIAETVDAAGLRLTEDDLAAIEEAVPRGAVAGERHAPALLALPDGERSGGKH